MGQTSWSWSTVPLKRYCVYGIVWEESFANFLFPFIWSRFIDFPFQMWAISFERIEEYDPWVGLEKTVKAPQYPKNNNCYWDSNREGSYVNRIPTTNCTGFYAWAISPPHFYRILRGKNTSIYFCTASNKSSQHTVPEWGELKLTRLSALM